jgi:hypothetical protein
MTASTNPDLGFQKTKKEIVCQLVHTELRLFI